MNDVWDFYGPYQISVNKVYIKNNYHAYDLSKFSDRLALSYLVENNINQLMEQLHLWCKLNSIIARNDNEASRD